CDVQAGSRGYAVDAADNGFLEPLHAKDTTVQALDERSTEIALEERRRALAATLLIAAGRERPSSPGEDYRSHRGVGLELDEDALHLAHHRLVHGVQSLGPVEGECHDAVVPVIQHRSIRHSRAPWGLRPLQARLGRRGPSPRRPAARTTSTVGLRRATIPSKDPTREGTTMPDVLYVGLQDDDKIVSFGIDAGAGKLVPRAETPAAGAPSAFAVSPHRHVLYVGYRGTPAIESCRIDPGSGALTSLGRVATEHWPTYLATDRAGKYLLSVHYQGGYAAVYRLGSDGAVSAPALDRQNTAPGAHAIL